MTALAFGSYNKKIPDAKTHFDWLSVNEKNVTRYIEDPKCGFPFTVSAFHELMTVLQHVNTPNWYAAIRKDIPLYIISGKDDPIGNYGVGVTEVANGLKEAGVTDVTLQLYDGMRHEILNEKDATIVYQDILEWCQRVLWKS